MGNSFGCSVSGERLVSAARDGDLVEAKMLLECNPGLAKYSTFGGLNSPLHFAASKGHNEIVALLLENGADVSSRNYCGQTTLMQACRYGHWEVVQTLLLFRCNMSYESRLSQWEDSSTLCSNQWTCKMHQTCCCRFCSKCSF
ncbi:E3 ubiquitin-protein ligase XBAT33-like isoform X5 [Vigna radiata var. radiata]|uniref:E3 ubiquitin-protein ligase XBAT33-like isoform X5 n=1 Tax=Vigna radiata var. radiata TaxID=3916 RepID=A0A1S3UU17_VIGRR|nr:E3 ubiquitin-protein ligase XBAT33-like isoform X5 [Vigna radiata var. radiata]